MEGMAADGEMDERVGQCGLGEDGIRWGLYRCTPRI